MYVKELRLVIKLLSFVIISLFLVYISLAVIPPSLLFFLNYAIHQGLSETTISLFFFIFSFFITLIAYFSTFLFDKRNWPQVEGSITNQYATNYLWITLPGKWYLKLRYNFFYNNHFYVKSCYEKVSFRSKQDAEEYSKKFSSQYNQGLTVYVFKYYPRFSSETPKMNAATLILYYFMVISIILTSIFGFIAYLVADGFVKIVTFSNYNGTSTNLVFEKHVSSLSSIFNLTNFIIFLLILLVFCIFFIKLIQLIRNNKISLFTPRYESDKKKSLELHKNLTKKVCFSCRAENESDSLFCLNCGAKLQ